MISISKLEGYGTSYERAGLLLKAVEEDKSHQPKGESLK